MQQWKLFVPTVLFAAVATMGAGCSGAATTSSSSGNVDTAVDAMVNASSTEGSATLTDDANADTVKDSSSLTNLESSYDSYNY